MFWPGDKAGDQSPSQAQTGGTMTWLDVLCGCEPFFSFCLDGKGRFTVAGTGGSPKLNAKRFVHDKAVYNPNEQHRPERGQPPLD